MSAAPCAVDDAVVDTAASPIASPGALKTGHGMTTVEHTMADAAAMRRALELASAAPPRREPAGRVRDPAPRTATCSPRAGTAAPAPPHAEVDALVQARARGAAARRHRRRHPRALQPHRPHRPLLRGAHRRRRRPRRLRGRRPRASARPAAPSGCATPGVEVDAGVLADEVDGAARRLARRRQRLGRPHVTVKWAASLDGRAAASDGTSQWITGAGRARRRAPPPRRRRRDRRRHRHRARRRPRAHGPRRRAASCYDAPADPRRARRAGRCPPTPRSRGIRTAPCSTSTATTSPPILADLRAAASAASSSRAARRSRARSCAAGLVDEVLAYVAPVLLGGRRASRSATSASTPSPTPGASTSPPSSGSATTC